MSIVKRQVVIKPIYAVNSFQAKNENLPDKDGNLHQYNANRVCRIWGKLDKNRTQVRAFDLGAEEKYYMPYLINKAPDDKEYTALVERYWANVLIEFSPNPGLILDISFVLNIGNEVELFVNGKSIKTPVSEETFKKYCHDKPELEYLFGMPVNMQNYWMWRFCLKTSQVANSKQLAVDKRGKKMQYYIHNDEEEMQTRAISVALKRAAMELVLKHSGDEDVVEGVLRVYEKGNTLNYGGKTLGDVYNYDELNKVQKQDYFMKVSELLPQEFIDIINDGNLKHKTFARRLINYGILTNPNGTTMYQFGEDIVADNFALLVNKLKNDKDFYKMLELRVRNLTNIRPIEVIKDIDKVITKSDNLINSKE